MLAPRLDGRAMAAKLTAKKVTTPNAVSSENRMFGIDVPRRICGNGSTLD
jgi:hypothetical protein